MRKLVSLQNSRDSEGRGDIRHILIDEEWPEDYFDEDLTPAFENISKEIDQYTGSNNYNNQIIKQSRLNYDRLRYDSLELAKMCLTYGFKDMAQEALEIIKMKAKTVEEAENKQKQIIQKIKMDQDDDNKMHFVVNFEDRITDLEYYLNGITLSDDITVAKYFSWKNKVDKKRAAQAS